MKHEENIPSSEGTTNQENDTASAKLANFAKHDEFTIPDLIFDDLPKLLNDSCNVFNDKYERDVFLTGTLSVLGGCFHNLYAFNEPDKRKVATNLLAIIVAPAASGKGALNYARKMARDIKTTFATNIKMKWLSSGNKLFIPANISSSGMIQLLAKNKGVGVMVESEIDTIVNANRQEWGNYTEIIRKSFENEEYTMYRKGKDKAEYIEIESLKLSLAISGTPNQFKQLIYSSESGLFSRGTYYVFDPSDEKLKFTGRMNSDVDLDSKFAQFAKIANDYYELHTSLDEIQVVFTKYQLDEISAMLQEVHQIWSEGHDLTANIKRAFVMAQKIAAILTLLSECESGSLQNTLSCSNKMLDNAINLTVFYLTQAYNAYELLPVNDSVSLNKSQQRLLQALPEEFTMSESIQVGNEISIKQRTVYDVIEKLEKKGLIKLQSTGKYKKE